ncbi:MAG TPA: FAD-dependent oxidoreductase, partial [Limnochordia bacterium]|nr:FAD-dependent oxidoreductase [Limnochordia bacterium]
PDGVTVQIGNERLAAGRIVVALGAWAPASLGRVAGLGQALQVVRKVLFWFDAGAVTDAWLGAPIFIWETPNGESFYGIPPETAAEGVKTAIHSGGEPTHPDALDRSVRAADIEAMRAFLRKRLPSVAEAPVLRSAVCMYTMTPDTHFVLGLHPEQPNVAVAAGFSGHGFKFASVVGEILADLATDGATRQPIGLFDPARFGSGGAILNGAG